LFITVVLDVIEMYRKIFWFEFNDNY